MDLIVTDTNGTPSGSYASWTLDLAYGSGENDFDLQCPARLKPGCRWWVDGTGWGGIVDDVKTSVTGGEGELTYHGRDWHGLLASKILEPDKGKDYLTMSGTIGTLLRTVISRIGLQDISPSRKARPKTQTGGSTGTATRGAACPRCCAHQDCGCASPQRRTA